MDNKKAELTVARAIVDESVGGNDAVDANAGRGNLPLRDEYIL